MRAVLAVVPVTNIEKAIEWYSGFFGRDADTRPMDSLAEWHLSELGVVQVFEDTDRAGRTAVNLTVDDLDATLRRLAEQNIESTDPQVVAGGRQRLAVVQDPDGNNLGLIASLD
ncbi:VOC family protein [Kribbella sp. NPDC051770]|uniref:VOC family protein n=1 Tax=Kribbella sp. NPDC051770 TaxID=3155413 RepID=UPI003412DF25